MNLHRTMNGFQHPHAMEMCAVHPRINFGPAWLVPLFFLPIAMLAPDTGLALYACIVLGVGTALLWRPGEPPILLLIFLVQWLQVAIGLFYGTFLGRPINSLGEMAGSHQKAVFLLLTGLLILAFTIRLAAGPSIRGLFPRVQVFVAVRPLRFWVWVFIVAWIFSAACALVAWASGGLRQILLSLADIKWAAFILLTLATFAVPNRSRVPWVVVFSLQLALSIGGFFSDFKDVFLYALIGLVASNMRLRFRMLLTLTILASVLLFFVLVWSAIKIEYRDFVNQGSGQQVVLVSYSERITEIAHLVSNLYAQDLPDAADKMIRRLMYFQLFGVVLDRVPNVHPHTDGQIWLDAVRRPFMPRLLFPNKSAVNDTDLTGRYTGIGFAATSRETSVSMGYMAEAYIDFGATFMFLPIAGFGLFLGAFYRRLLSRPGLGAALGVALAPFALMPALLSETSSLKSVPALFLSIISCWLILNILAPRFFGLPRKSRRNSYVWFIQHLRA
jgi:hypothetical protein